MTVVIRWRDLTLGGPRPNPFRIEKLTGWIGAPAARFDAQESTRGHGEMPSPGRRPARIVYATGHLFTRGPVGRDELIDRLSAAQVPARADSAATERLEVTAAGRTAYAQAQSVLWSVPVDAESWSAPTVEWSMQWRCPDPRVFGPEMFASAPLESPTPGVKLPLQLPVSLPPKAVGGTLRVLNPGNDPEGSPTVIILTGQQSNVGLVNATTGKRVMFDFPLGPDDQLRIDTDLGVALLNNEYRPTSGFSDVVDDMRLAPGANTLRATGVPGSGSPSIQVAVRPASW